MDLIPTLVNALVVMLVGAVVTYLTRTQIQDMKRELAEVKQELRGEITELRRELRSEVASIRSDLTSIRSDLTQIALAVGVQPRPQTG